MTRNGSITLGLLIGFTLGGAVVGGGAGWFLTAKSRDARHLSEMETAAHAHQQEQDALQGRVEALTGDLATYKAKTTPESLTAAATGTTDALGAALAPALAEVQARAGIVSAVTLDRYAQALIDSASPRMVVADGALARCVAMTAVKSADLTGCGNNGPVIAEWVKAVEAQAACPSPVLDPDPVRVGL